MNSMCLFYYRFINDADSYANKSIYRPSKITYSMPIVHVSLYSIRGVCVYIDTPHGIDTE